MYLASRADSSIGTVPLPTPHAHCLKRMPTCAERSNMHSRRHPRQPHTNALATGLPSRRRRLRCGHCPPPAARRAQVRKESAFPATFRRLPAPQQPAATASTQRPVGPSGAGQKNLGARMAAGCSVLRWARRTPGPCIPTILHTTICGGGTVPDSESDDTSVRVARHVSRPRNGAVTASLIHS